MVRAAVGQRVGAGHQHLQRARGLLARGRAHDGAVRPAVIVHALAHALDEERPLLPRVVGVRVVPASTATCALEIDEGKGVEGRSQREVE